MMKRKHGSLGDEGVGWEKAAICSATQGDLEAGDWQIEGKEMGSLKAMYVSQVGGVSTLNQWLSVGAGL